MMQSRVALFIGLGIVLSLALWSLQPAASTGISGATALLFWALHVAVLLPLLYGAQAALLRLPSATRWPGVITVIASGALGALAFTPFAMGLDVLFQVSNDVSDNGSLIANALEEYAGFVFPVATVWLLINARQLAQLSVPKLASEPRAEERELSEEETAFWTLIPPALGHDLIALSAEQHYVRVYTAKGETLVLFSFGRAVDAAARFDGVQVHRSHWVNLDHVTDLVGTNRNLKCQLSNGLALPVSRANAALVREAMEIRRSKAIALA